MEAGVKRVNTFDTEMDVSADKKMKTDEAVISTQEVQGDGLASTTQESPGIIQDDEKSNVATNVTIIEPDSERWQVSCRTMKQRMSKIYKSDCLTDCTFTIVDNATTKTYRLHSLILSMASPVFEDLLNESTNKEIKLDDIDPDVFEQVVEYVYLDNISLGSIEKAQGVYRVAQKFKLTLIIEKAVELMMANMSFESIWPTLEAAHVTNDSILKNECYKYLKKHTKELLRHPKFVTVDASVLEDLVSEEVLTGVSEAELVAGVMKWSKAQCIQANIPSTLDNRRNCIGDKVLSKLRFLAFPQLTFVREIAFIDKREEDAILSREESYLVLLNLISPGIEPLPDIICKDSRSRIEGKLHVSRRVFNPMGTYPIYTTPFSVGQYDKMVVLASPSPIASFGAKNFSCEVMVSFPILLYGIQVPTFFSPAKTASMEYDESYVITVQHYNNRNILTTTWKGKVKYNTTLEVMLTEPVPLDKNVTYAIMIFTSNMYYVSRKLTNVESRPPVQFSFKDVVSYFGAPSTAKLGTDYGFVTDLVYTLQNK